MTDRGTTDAAAAADRIRIAAVIVAGGRGTRLGGALKPLAVHRGETLLEHALTAARSVSPSSVVVVGPPELEGLATRSPASLVREDPPFGGPVAAIAAGLDALSPSSPDSEWALVLAADLVDPATAITALVRAAAAGGDGFDGPRGVDAFLAVDADGREQYLLGLYRIESLRGALAALPTVADASVRSLVSRLVLKAVTVPDSATRDVDTEEDLLRWDVELAPATPPATMEP